MIQTFQTHLTSKIQITHNVYLFRFVLDNPKELKFTSGQYMVMFIPQPNGDPARRLYSIASSSTPIKSGSTEKNSFELLVEIIPGGVASEFLLKLEPDTEVTFQGPAGRFTLKPNDKNKVFFATGTGLAPVKSIIETQLATNNNPSVKYHLLWGLPTFKDVYFLDKFKKLAADYPNFSFKICVSRENSLDSINEEDRKYFALGRITEELEPSLNTKYDIPNTDFYLCGSRNVIESLKNYLSENKAENSCIVYEKF